MPETGPDTASLLRLIESATEEAHRMGSAAAAVCRHLDDAAAEARAIAARGGRPEEGVPIDRLTTGNDQ